YLEGIDPPKPSLLCGWSGYGDAKFRQPAAVITDESVPVQPIEVVTARVAVRHAMAQDVPHRDEDRVGDGRDGFLVPAPASHAVILRCQIAVPGAHGTSCTLDQGGAQPAVAFPALARFALASAFVVAGTDARPGGRLGRGRKATHVGLELGQ